MRRRYVAPANRARKRRSVVKGWCMKKILVPIGFFIVFVVMAGHLHAQDVKGPKISAVEIKYDFGEVVQGTQASHVFEVRNVGDEPLIIDRVVPS
jgi:hypothetical protein